MSKAKNLKIETRKLYYCTQKNFHQNRHTFFVDKSIRIKPKKILMKLLVKKVKIFSIGSTLQIQRAPQNW
jgi:hypothetical protein